ncbi:c-type cytochrome, methanol metabolism-related [Methylobacterium sp. Leaf118]|uniref:c-type cytochrome, methanol metabolism-related n=1 Tax=Methylobacterium sp. Leaf118 TaxID=2876562 RepID=UPI001E637BCC|nr:c-type cytochrome, methanol metabolism-related [Methylobacterium sp. Leaf118]
MLRCSILVSGETSLTTKNTIAVLGLIGAGFLGALSTATFVAAQDAKPELANKLDPNAKELDEPVLKAATAAKEEDGKYTDKDGHPTFRITNDGKKVDWYTYSGYRRYHAECHVCHGPDGMGSTYAPALKDSLKRLSYEEFYGILAGGRQNHTAGNESVMPAFGDNKNVMCYANDLYVYLRARASGAWGRARPGEKEDKPETVKKEEKECLGG